MTQQAVSKNIARLEESFGFPLLYRNHHNVGLTVEGKRIYRLFSQFCLEYEVELQHIQQNLAEGFYRLNIGYQNWIDFGSGPSRALKQMKEHNKNIFLIAERHSPVILLKKLMSGEMDLVVMYEMFSPRGAEINKQILCYSPLLLMVSLDHPLITGVSTYEDFLHEPYLFDSFEYETNAEINTRANEYIQKWGLKPRDILVFPNRDSAYTAAELGHGFIVTTEANRISKSKALKKYPMNMNEPLVAIWKKDNQAEAIQTFVDCLAEKMPDELR